MSHDNDQHRLKHAVGKCKWMWSNTNYCCAKKKP